MGVLEQSRRGRLLVAGLIALGVVLGGVAQWVRVARARAASGVVRARPVPGEGRRIVVEVLNASGVVGLARSATSRLRDGGIDVVFYGSDTAQTLDSTQVLVRRGESARGETVRRVLGAGEVRYVPDPGRLVDVTVRLGRDFGPLARNP